MLLGVPRESYPGERRAPLVPDGVKKLIDLGFQVVVESGVGDSSEFFDPEYESAGAKVASRNEILESSDIILRLRKPPKEEVSQLKKGCIHISFLDPFNEQELVEELSSSAVSAISMEMIPRTTLAQKMDALSSQANLAGYLTVVIAADHLDRVFPMMMTPSGTIPPARVFIIGAGVAGLQAIATAKRLGARVEAFDTRPVVAEQVQSLGAKFVEIDLGDTGQTKQGYAKQLSEEQLEKQRREMTKVCAHSDVVITTAQLFGRKAPVIVTAEMVAAMKPGSVLVDMAVETGGNVEGSKLDEIVEVGGVSIIGFGNLPSRVCHNASAMYSNNLINLIGHLWDKESKTLSMTPETDEILKGCLITRGGEVVHDTFRERYQKAEA